MDEIEFYGMMVAVIGIELSPLWLPMGMLLRWRRTIRARVRFVVLTCLALAISLIGIELAFEEAAYDGLMWFERYHQACAGIPRAICGAFDFFHAYRVFLAIALYSALALGLVAVLWVRKPRWIGFEMPSTQSA